MRTICLLICSNIFMTIAWYGHLKYKSVGLWKVILLSWLIALPEYALQVPANRFGHGPFSAAQLKIIQEVISISVFIVFCLVYLRESIRWNYIVSFILIAGAVFFGFLKPPVSAREKGVLPESSGSGIEVAPSSLLVQDRPETN